MKKAVYNGIAMTIDYCHEQFQPKYIIRTGKEVFKGTDWEDIYLYFDRDYTDKKDKDFARRMAFEMLVDAIIDAWGCGMLYIQGKLVDTWSAEQMVYFEIASLAEQGHAIYTPANTDKEKWETMCIKLDLNPKKTRRIYWLGTEKEYALYAEECDYDKE